MKKVNKVVVAVMALFAVVLLSGCATYQVSKDFNGQQINLEDSSSIPVAYIHAKNYGYYLFNTYPIISGNCKKVGTTSWFTDNVNPQDTVDLLTKKANELGASKTIDIQTTHRESGAYTFWIFWYRGSQASGTAIK